MQKHDLRYLVSSLKSYFKKIKNCNKFLKYILKDTKKLIEINSFFLNLNHFKMYTPVF